MGKLFKKFCRRSRSLELEWRLEMLELSGAYSPCFFQKVGGSMRNPFEEFCRRSRTQNPSGGEVARNIRKNTCFVFFKLREACINYSRSFVGGVEA